MTKDGHLVTSHDPCLKATTNILDYAAEYADRVGTWSFEPAYDNDCTDDYLIREFTLEELKGLRRRQRYSTRNTDLDDLFQIMTFEEVIEQMQGLYQSHPKTRPWKIGLYVETKMYQFYLDNYGENIAQMTYDVLKKYGLETIDKCKDTMPIIIECFEG